MKPNIRCLTDTMRPLAKKNKAISRRITLNSSIKPKDTNEQVQIEKKGQK